MDNTQFFKAFCQLYILITHADGELGEKEIRMGEKIMMVEGFKADTLTKWMEQIMPADNQRLLRNSIELLSHMKMHEQIRVVAWLCILANSDFSMDKREWALIYKIYHTELNLPLNEIMHVHWELKQSLARINRKPTRTLFNEVSNSNHFKGTRLYPSMTRPINLYA
jgi:uncharacterized tellurite resistance protein B-like protein